VDGTPVIRDEGIRPTTLDGLARLEPAFRTADEGGRVTAGNACQISDGAAAVLIMSALRAAELGLRPLARFAGYAVTGSDPRLMLTACAPATAKVLAATGLTLADVDLFEVNEAFASVVLAWERELDGVDLKRVNVNGGAIALGHPLGASGARIVTTLVHELDRSGGRYGLATIGEGGGMANALLLERV
jgi:acetyl-CoA acyltransferase